MLVVLLLAGLGCATASVQQASVANNQRATTTTTMQTRSTVATTQDVATPDEAEAARRLDDANIDPGGCGSVVYTPTGSTSYAADVCLPENRTSNVVVLLVHGGGGTGGKRSDLRPWQEAYSNLGYITLSIDYRLTDPDTDRQVWPEPEQDLKAAVQFVRLLEPTLGTDQMIVQGHSAGARLGSVIYTTPDDPTFAGAALWSNVSDRVDGFVGLYGYYDGYQFEPDAYYGEAGSPPEASAIDNAAQASGDALLITGNADTLINHTQTEKLAQALQRAGHDAQTIELSGRGHQFDLEDGALTGDGWAMAAAFDSWMRTKDDLT